MFVLTCAAWSQEFAVVDGASEYGEGVVAYAAGDQVNLRSEPSLGASVVARLPFGAAVALTGSGEPGEVDGRADRWYPATADGVTGYIWGGTLTLARFALDFDRDGANEVATAAFAADHALVLRVAGAGGIAVQRLGPGSALLNVSSPEQGRPLLRVFQPGDSSSRLGFWTVQGSTWVGRTWESRASDAGWERVEVGLAQPEGLSVAVRRGTRAPDGSGVEEITSETLVFGEAGLRSVGEPVVRRRSFGSPVEPAPLAGDLSPGSPERETTADLDGDGAEERVRFALVDHAVVVTVLDGASKANHRFEPFHRTFSDEFLDRALVGVSTESGVPLLVVQDPGEEMCGSTSTATYLSWDGAALRVALEVSSWADAPSFSYDVLTFDPTRRTAEIAHHQGFDTFDTVTHSLRTFSDGVFAEGVK